MPDGINEVGSKHRVSHLQQPFAVFATASERVTTIVAMIKVIAAFLQNHNDAKKPSWRNAVSEALHMIGVDRHGNYAASRLRRWLI